MEIIRLKKENSILEKKKKELLNQIHELMAKNNSLNQEILSLKYSNKETNFSKYSNMITDLNKTISYLKEKINQITKEKNDLEKINNELKISINSYKSEKQKQFKECNSKDNILSDMKRKNEILNKNYTTAENEKKNYKKMIQELTEQNNNIKNEFFQIQKENVKLNQKITDIDKIKENYKEKYNRISKELNDERDINIFNEQKIKKLERKLEEYQINEFDDTKTKTYKVNKINKVNEIEMEKLSKKSYNSPNYLKNTSTFSTNNTTNKISLVNNLEALEISPENFTIIKQFKLSNNLKWYLLKRIKKLNSGMKEENSPSPIQGYKQTNRRFKYFKLNSKTNNIMYSDDSYSDFVWKSNKNEKEFINFNTDLIDNEINDNSTNKESQKKITELESYIKELEEKLEKKENDYYRINLNYAKLFNRTKTPENTYDKLLENIDKLKEENKNLTKKIENLKSNQNFIGLSFIEDDLDGSRFIDDNGFEELLNELDRNKGNKNKDYNSSIDMMKFFRSHEDDKDNNKRKSLTRNNDKNYMLYKRRDISAKKIFEENNKLKTENYKEINLENSIQIKTIINKDHISYFDKYIKSPNKYNNNTVENRKSKIDDEKLTVNTNNDNDDDNRKREIYSIKGRFRKTFKKILNINNNLEYNNIKINNNEISSQIQNKENLNNKFLINVNTIKVDDKKNASEKRIETLQENTIKVNRFQRMRRFYKNRQGESISIKKEK